MMLTAAGDHGQISAAANGGADTSQVSGLLGSLTGALQSLGLTNVQLSSNLHLKGGLEDLHLSGVIHVSADVPSTLHASATTTAMGSVGAGDDTMASANTGISANMAGVHLPIDHIPLDVGMLPAIGGDPSGSAMTTASMTASGAGISGNAAASGNTSTNLTAGNSTANLNAGDSGQASAGLSNSGAASGNIAGSSVNGESGTSANSAVPVGAILSPAGLNSSAVPFNGSPASPTDLNRFPDLVNGVANQNLVPDNNLLFTNPAIAPVSPSVFVPPALTPVNNSGGFVNPDLTSGDVQGVDNFFSQLGSVSPLQPVV